MEGDAGGDDDAVIVRLDVAGLFPTRRKAVAVTERLQSFVTSRCFTVCVCVCVRERARPRARARTFQLRGNSQDSH